MLIASFDVGMKNLAICISSYNMDKNMPKILLWDILDIRPVSTIVKCQYQCKNCTHPAKKEVNGVLLCGVHSRCKDGKIFIQNTPSQDLFTKLVVELDKVEQLLDCDVVLIEQQPKCNPTMRMIASSLLTYFVIKGIRVSNKNMKHATFFSPRKKLAASLVGDNVDTMTYAARKKASVNICKNLVKEQSEEIENIFKKSKKKDDLADSYLQTIAYIDSLGL